MIGTAAAAPVGAQEEGGQHAGVTVLLAIVIVLTQAQWVAQSH